MLLALACQFSCWFLTIGTRDDDPSRIAMPDRRAPDGHGDLSAEDLREEEERAIAGMVLYIASTSEPNIIVTMGPGLPGAPTLYIGVMRPIHLYLKLETWCLGQGVGKPSFQTLLRAVDQCGCIRFRKVAGQHVNCDN